MSVLPARRGGETQLHGRGEVLEDAAPGGFVVGATAMTLIDHDEVKKVGRVLPKPGGGLAIQRRPTHEGLEDCDEHAGVGGHPAFLAQVIGFDPRQGVLLKGGKGGEVFEGLISEVVAVGQKQDAGPAVGFAGEIPAGGKQLPEDLEGDRGFAGAGGQRQQDAVLAGGDRLQHPLHGDLLVEADLPAAALVGVGDGGEAITPGVLFGEGARPQLLGRGEAVGLPLLARIHVDRVDALAVAGVGEAQLELGGVLLGLTHAFGERQPIGLGFHHRQGGVAVAEHVVGAEALAAAAAAFNAPGGNRKLAANAAALHHTPTGRHQQRIDQLSAGFGLVHGSRLPT